MTTQPAHRWILLVQLATGLLLGGAILLARPLTGYAAWLGVPQGPPTPTTTPTPTHTVLVATATSTGTVLSGSPTPWATATAGGTVLVGSPTAPPVTPTYTVLVATPSATASVSETAPPTASLTASPTATPTPLCAPAWRSVPPPATGPIQGLSAPGPTDVWAVADSPTTGILHWDGLAWNPVPYPTAPAPPRFWAVAAAGPSSAWAAGAAQGVLPARIQHWDGAGWQVLCCDASAPQSPATTYDYFSAVTILGTDPQTGEAYAVRAQGAGTFIQSILMRCTATTCIPLATAMNAHLDGVAAVAANDVWAVGTGVYHWDGTNLARVFSPPTGILRAVAARAADDVWAAGALYDTITSHSLLAHWDGQSWSVVPSPDIGGLTAVAVRAADDAWAVGNGILHWDGSAWTVAQSLNATLSAVAAVAGDDVWTGGLSGTSDPVLLHYTPQRFADVPPAQTFYPYIQWMACRGYIGGYPCGGPGEPCPGTYYRPGNTVTRGQLLKMVVNAAGWTPAPPATATFEDVPPASTFAPYVETGVSHDLISGYPCSSPGEPCVAPGNRPYFRPNNPMTRGQLSKVIALARGYPLPAPGTPTFADVPAGSTFFGYVEAMAAHSIVAGYPCGGPGEPCDPPANRPYFRPNANATRGQVAKFVTLAYGGP